LWSEGGDPVSKFSESLEKSVQYLRERYPADLPLLVGLEKKLEYLKAKNRSSSNDVSSTTSPLD